MKYEILIAISGILIGLGTAGAAIFSLRMYKRDSDQNDNRFNQSLQRLQVIVDNQAQQDSSRDAQFNASLRRLAGIQMRLEDAEQSKVKDLKLRLANSLRRILDLSSNFIGSFGSEGTSENIELLKRVSTEFLYLLRLELINPNLTNDSKLFPAWKLFLSKLEEHAFPLSGGYGLNYQELQGKVYEIQLDFYSNVSGIKIDPDGTLHHPKL